MAKRLDYSKIRRKPAEYDQYDTKNLEKAFSKTKMVLIYTDGSCLRNPGGPGGWAAIVKSGDSTNELFGHLPSCTNNIAELTGPIMALRSLQSASSVILFSDSQYVVNGAEKWIKGWKRRGWKTQDGDPVKNRDLWEQIDVLMQLHQVSWRWVRGHNGHRENERCDQLAGMAATKQISSGRTT